LAFPKIMRLVALAGPTGVALAAHAGALAALGSSAFSVLLAAAAGAVGPGLGGFFALVLVACAVVCCNRL
jgi:hypothetical protein